MTHESKIHQVEKLNSRDAGTDGFYDSRSSRSGGVALKQNSSADLTRFDDNPQGGYTDEVA